MKGFNFTIRYAKLPSEIIYNECGPNLRKHSTEESIQRLIENRNKKDKFYDLLEKSILEQGVRNPIIICAGWIAPTKFCNLPIEMQEDKSTILVCDRHGGSRLFYAQKHKFKIPCIINDFCNRFPDAIQLHSQDDVLNRFPDRPQRIIINEHGVHIRGLPQIHLGKNK